MEQNVYLNRPEQIELALQPAAGTELVEPSEAAWLERQVASEEPLYEPSFVLARRQESCSRYP